MFGYFIFLVMAKPCLSVAVVSFVAHTELLVLTHWSCSRCKVTEADFEFDPRGCSRCQGWYRPQPLIPRSILIRWTPSSTETLLLLLGTETEYEVTEYHSWNLVLPIWHIRTLRRTELEVHRKIQELHKKMAPSRKLHRPSLFQELQQSLWRTQQDSLSARRAF